MFEKLQERLESTFKKLRGYGKLSETNIKDSLREVRVALLEADVNYKVAKDFLGKVKEKVLGEDSVWLKVDTEKMSGGNGGRKERRFGRE